MYIKNLWLKPVKSFFKIGISEWKNLILEVQFNIVEDKIKYWIAFSIIIRLVCVCVANYFHKGRHSRKFASKDFYLRLGSFANLMLLYTELERRKPLCLSLSRAIAQFFKNSIWKKILVLSFKWRHVLLQHANTRYIHFKLSVTSSLRKSHSSDSLNLVTPDSKKHLCEMFLSSSFRRKNKLRLLQKNERKGIEFSMANRILSTNSIFSVI